MCKSGGRIIAVRVNLHCVISSVFSETGYDIQIDTLTTPLVKVIPQMHNAIGALTTTTCILISILLHSQLFVEVRASMLVTVT